MVSFKYFCDAPIQNGGLNVYGTQQINNNGCHDMFFLVTDNLVI